MARREGGEGRLQKPIARSWGHRQGPRPQPPLASRCRPTSTYLLVGPRAAASSSELPSTSSDDHRSTAPQSASVAMVESPQQASWAVMDLLMPHSSLLVRAISFVCVRAAPRPERAVPQLTSMHSLPWGPFSFYRSSSCSDTTCSYGSGDMPRACSRPEGATMCRRLRLCPTTPRLPLLPQPRPMLTARKPNRRANDDAPCFLTAWTQIPAFLLSFGSKAFYEIWAITLIRSPVTPMAVTSPPAPAPCTINGLLPYLSV